MKECLLDAIFDTLKITPYLFIMFVFLEIIEHKFSNKAQKTLTKYKKSGPFIGGILGSFPQCGFSAIAANLYTNKMITMGTLIAVFLSTSDEMLPIFLSEKVPFLTIAKVIGFKVIIGILFGIIIDIIFKSKISSDNIKKMCDEEHCHCKEGTIISSIAHTLKITGFILFANILIGMLIYFIGIDTLTGLLNRQNIFVYFIASLIGLIPNCASSVILTKVYLSKIITFGSAMSGLLTGSGIGILLLFRKNKSIKENMIILSTIYFVGVLVGMLIDLFL